MLISIIDDCSPDAFIYKNMTIIYKIIGIQYILLTSPCVDIFRGVCVMHGNLPQGNRAWIYSVACMSCMVIFSDIFTF